MELVINSLFHRSVCPSLLNIHSLNYYSFLRNLDKCYCKSSKLTLLQKCLVLLGTLHFSYIWESICLITHTYTNVVGMYWICMSVWRNQHFYNIKLSTHKHGAFLHLYRSLILLHHILEFSVKRASHIWYFLIILCFKNFFFIF